MGGGGCKKNVGCVQHPLSKPPIVSIGSFEEPCVEIARWLRAKDLVVRKSRVACKERRSGLELGPGRLIEHFLRMLRSPYVHLRQRDPSLTHFPAPVLRPPAQDRRFQKGAACRLTRIPHQFATEALKISLMMRSKISLINASSTSLTLSSLSKSL